MPTKRKVEKPTFDATKIRETVRCRIYEAIKSRNRCIIGKNNLHERARKIETSILNHLIRTINHANNTVYKKKPLPKKIVICKDFRRITT